MGTRPVAAADRLEAATTTGGMVAAACFLPIGDMDVMVCWMTSFVLLLLPELLFELALSVAPPPVALATAAAAAVAVAAP